MTDVVDARTVVIGGGVTGLAAATRLRERGIDALVLEASDRVGGKLRTHDVDGLTLDAGAESLLTRRPEGVALVEAAGRSTDLVSPATSGASIWRDGEGADSLTRLPSTQLLGIPTDPDDPDLETLLGADAVQRIRAEPAMGEPLPDESVGELVRRQLGDGVADLLVEPLLGGVYAGRADDISVDMAVPGLLRAAERTGSLVAAARSMRDTSTTERSTRMPDDTVFATVPGGLGSLGESLVHAQRLDVRTGTAATQITGKAGEWAVETSTGETVAVDRLIVAVQGFAAATLLVNVAPEVATTASELDYATVALVTVVFDHDDLSSLPEGTGFLVPAVAGRLTKAATFVSQKWQWVRDAAAGRQVLRFSVGRQGDARGLDLSDEQLTAAVLDEVGELLGVRGRPRASAVTRWAQSLPQYRVGHRGRTARARERLPAGLAIAGAAWDGVGIPACIASGWAAADLVAGGE